MSIRTEDDIERIYVLRAIVIINEAVIRWANRYADLAENMAAETEDKVRREELLQISKMCRKVPAEPAETFRKRFSFSGLFF